MTAITGIANTTEARQQLHGPVLAQPAASSSGSTSAGDGSSISSNDFLTLLVTEMQNQDPTATTDPNEYINQLVNVNSLEQLISINQTLKAAMSSSGSSTPSSSVVHAAASTAQGLTTHGTPSASAAARERESMDLSSPDLAAGNGQAVHAQSRAAGNLTIPPISAAAQRVAQALGAPGVLARN